MSKPTHSSRVYTAEFVSPKHPDKLCDRISDAILAAHQSEDPKARVAVDVAGGHGTVFVVGEVTSRAKHVDIEQIVHEIAGEGLEVITRIAAQSPEIARGVDTGGAGDQGIMVGYACTDTPELLPLEYVLARNLNQYLYSLWPYDGKTQVTVQGGCITHLVASFQHAPHDELSAAVFTWLRHEPLAKADEAVELFINQAGDWDIGGFDADSGLTGRKIVVDAYGPRVPVGGGAFSGKDMTKVDRSGAILARELAVKELKRTGAHEVLVYLAYVIGRADPIQKTIITH